MRKIQIKPITNEKEYEEALALVERHFDAETGTELGNAIHAITILVENYEDTQFPMPSSAPIEAIKFKMDQLGMRRRDLERYLGSRGRVSEVLGRKRQLTVGMIRSLHRNLGIPAETLLAVSNGRKRKQHRTPNRWRRHRVSRS